MRGFSLIHRLRLLLCITMITSVMLVSFPTFAASVAPVSLSTNSNSYLCMQPVGLYANLTSNGTPVPNGVLAFEVDFENAGWPPILLRSLKGSQNPAPGLLDNDIQVIVTPVDVNMVPQTGFKRGSWGYFNVTIVNSGGAVEGLIAWSAMDAASVPIGTNSIDAPGSFITIPTDSTSKLQASVDIPSWAAIGTATIYINIFSDAPYRGGYPITKEASSTFQIENSFGPLATAEGSENRPSLEYKDASSSMNGLYNFSYRVPPKVVFGTYTAYAVSSSAPTQLGVAKFQVTAASKPPQAIFTYSPLAPYANETVYFDASSSYSYNGTITNYKWNWGDGSTQQSTPHPTITHVFKAKGTYAVTLNVTDSQELWGLSEEPVSVSGPTPPVASFVFTPNPTWINASTKFDASGSTPGWNGTGNPPIVSYIWNFGDSTPVVTTSSTATYHQFRKTGVFLAILIVKDTRGWNGTTAQNVPVQVTGTPPVAIFTVEYPRKPYVGGMTTFDAEESYSHYGTITNYTWNWSDGSAPQSTSHYLFSHTFTSAGTFAVTLNVTDNMNLWDVTEEPVKIWPTTPPVANFTVTSNPTWINASTKFDASGSTPGWNGTGNPPIVSYIWNFGDGTPVVTTSSTVTYHQFKVPGNFSTTLTVMDTRGWSNSTDQAVEVTTPALSVTIPPSSIIIFISKSQTFRATASGGTPPYTTYYWGYGTSLSSAKTNALSNPTTSPKWTFSPSSTGLYYVVCIVTDSVGGSAESHVPVIVILIHFPRALVRHAVLGSRDSRVNHTITRFVLLTDTLRKKPIQN